MSSNISVNDQNQAVTSMLWPGPPDSPDNSVFLPNNGGQQGGFQVVPVFMKSVPIPFEKLPSEPSEQIQHVATVYVEYGIDGATRVAAQYHERKNAADALTREELWKRIDDAEANMGETFKLFQQGKPGAIASRLLAARAGHRYGYEELESTVTENGIEKTGHKCEARDCEYRNKDRTRHQEEMHVKDPVFALYCPSGCGQVYYRGRDCQMTRHIKCYQGKQHGIVTSK